MPPIDESVPEHIEHRLRMPDGRTLAVAEWGEPDGTPWFALHGTPGGRIGWWQEFAIYRRFRVRRFTVDRPGYGESTRLPGRSVADIVADVASAADQLGADQFLVSGGSGGGPHALACAALLPDRVIRCEADVSVAPYSAEGLDWFAGQTEGNVIEFRTALEGEAPLRPLLEGLRSEMLVRLAEHRLDWIGDDYHLSEADLAQAEKHFARTRAHVTSALVDSADGWVDDNLAFTKPWGFGVEDIQVPVLLTYGRTDVLVPAGHGDWLAAHVPGAMAWVDEDAGHFGNDDAVERQMTWLTGHPPFEPPPA